MGESETVEDVQWPEFPRCHGVGKGYYFVRWADRETGKTVEKTLGRDKAEAERRYEEWRREFTEKLYSAPSPQPAQPSQPAKSSQSAKPPHPSLSAVSYSINDLVLDYIKSHRIRYKKGSFVDYQRMGKLLSEMFGKCDAEAFRIPQFRQLIDCMIGKGWSLRTINVGISAVKLFFRHALECGLVTGEQFHQLNSGVDPVRSSDRRVKPSRKVLPVPVDVVRRTLPFLTPMVKDIVIVHFGGAMRAAEVCRMRFDELGWTAKKAIHYQPVEHKNASRGKDRPIFLGPEAQKILATYGVTPEVIKSGEFPREYVFDPRDAERRKSDLQKARKTGTLPYFDSTRYIREVRHGVNRAIAEGAITEAERWTSHQLRHRAVTDTRRELGLDAAQLTAGHSDAKTTQRYAAPDMSKAEQAAMERGDELNPVNVAALFKPGTRWLPGVFYVPVGAGAPWEAVPTRERSNIGGGGSVGGGCDPAWLG